ncbi:DUF4479 domain-containing protein [Sediminibacillus dalangtanensis]|uniref:DUF4479 domain-containing protein n=1 Tax=Sediminibacillus dalangtanensis TaxID=2729421 RepID=A0ABX7VWY3_9BACI|nr:DUF4479 domain-containing protein [Sediminibacillus dalangtanensis]QTN00111.1 DUF4479 domain-containing protein [Sediminibacillus dalangtanensis]
MDVFYNPNGIGDVLIVPIKQGNRNHIKKETFGKVVKITDEQNGALLGYNIFDAASQLSLAEAGKITLTEELAANIQDVFSQNGLQEAFDVDLTPKFVVGFVKEKQPHENADKLSVCQVDTGDETLQIVCGAPNIDKDQKVVVAKVGAVMPSGMEIKPTKLRGVDSFGMICSQKELGLPNAPKEKGIYVLDDGYQVGQIFEF